MPKRQANRWRLEPKERADVEDNFRKTITQLFAWLATLFAGVIALAAAVIAYLQLSEQQRAAQDLLISNQVSKGFEQLGSDKAAVRLGGIYALEGVMNNSRQYHQPVLEALCAFVRDGTQPKAGNAPAPKADISAPATDIQAALTVIGRREAAAGDDVNLAHAHIPNAYLYGANLTDADLMDADLSGAVLAGAHLDPADVGHADLRGARLTSAHLRKANLTQSDLSGADLNNADLREADLTVADLREAGPDDANLSGADLRRAQNLTQAQLDTACGDDKTRLDPPLTIKPCPPDQPAGGGSK